MVLEHYDVTATSNKILLDILLIILKLLKIHNNNENMQNVMELLITLKLYNFLITLQTFKFIFSDVL